MIQTAGYKKISCFHCGDLCIDENIHLDNKVFCCNGCKAVYEILNDHELCVNESCMSLFRALLNMEELEKGGLIETEYFALKVTPLGEIFIRNVCMALDSYLQVKEKSVVQFSKVI
jgi:hypothetical protein